MFLWYSAKMALLRCIISHFKNTLSLLKIPILFILGIFEIACRKTHRQNETSKSERSNTVIFS
ncbi:hypothetical protein LEP1GSC171_0440 [Leptospira santarosai str. HAI1380]|nr:hypothetical protein LEP1GSC171_0440 [Leptospira santarosai str. HAI1380]